MNFGADLKMLYHRTCTVKPLGVYSYFEILFFGQIDQIALVDRPKYLVRSIEIVDHSLIFGDEKSAC